MTVAPHSFDADEFHDSAEPHASAEPASPAAVLKDIRFSYDRGTSWALDGVSLTVHAGERLCLVGPNGSGKSTLARLIAGLTAPDGGEVTLLGQRVYAAGPNADAYRAARHGIGMVFQNPEDQLVTTVLEDDVAFGPENLGLERELIGERIVDSLQAVGLANLRQSDPTRMSGGQQQRASIAGMLAMNPAMLVLDEPTAMLDPRGREQVMRTLSRIGEEDSRRAVVLVTHRLEEIPAGFDHIAIMGRKPVSAEDATNDGIDAMGNPSAGTIVYTGPLEAGLTDERLSELFGMPIEVQHTHGRWSAFAV